MLTFPFARLFGCRTANKMWDRERERLLGPSSSVRPALSLARCLCRTRVSRPILGIRLWRQLSPGRCTNQGHTDLERVTQEISNEARRRR